MILQCEESSIILYSGRRRRCSISMERKTKGRTLFIGFVGFATDLCKYSRLQTIWFSYFLDQKLRGKCNTFKPLFFATWKLKEFSVYGLLELFLFGRSLSIFCFIRCELGAVEVCL
jgi:hypothetical protein